MKIIEVEKTRSRIRTAIAVSSLLFCALAVAQTVEAPRVFSTDPEALRQFRDAMRARGANLPAAAAKVREDADRALKLAPVSVTSKPMLPPSGDKHDYMTLAPYWWPNPNTPNALPYIRRDGERNPEIRKIEDHKHFDEVMSGSYALALEYYLTGDERYAQHAAELLRAWFLDPSTRMNPNLQFAQGVGGINNGRGTGLIETRGIGKIVDALALLHGSKSWPPADEAGVEKWLSDFLGWMRDSKNGRDEAAAKNNHGTWYDAQVSVLALGTGKPDIARQVLEQAKTKRVAFQVEPDGRQPLELARTKSWGYSVMNLSGLFQLARLGDRAGVDLWHYRAQDGRGIRAALDYLVPFATGERKWTTKQIEPMRAADLAPLLLEAAVRYNAPSYREAALKIDPAAAQTFQAALLQMQSARSPKSGSNSTLPRRAPNSPSN
jgi:hypothetical protein